MQHDPGQFLIQHLRSLIAAGDGIDRSVNLLYDLHFRNPPCARIINDDVNPRQRGSCGSVDRQEEDHVLRKDRDG